MAQYHDISNWHLEQKYSEKDSVKASKSRRHFIISTVKMCANEIEKLIEFIWSGVWVYECMWLRNENAPNNIY